MKNIIIKFFAQSFGFIVIGGTYFLFDLVASSCFGEGTGIYAQTHRLLCNGAYTFEAPITYSSLLLGLFVLGLFIMATVAIFLIRKLKLALILSIFTNIILLIIVIIVPAILAFHSNPTPPI